VSLEPVERDDHSAPFFDATAEGHLVIRRCRECGHLMAPETRACTRCYSAEADWVAASGRGTLESWVVVHRRAAVEGAAATRSVVGLVELEEGPWLRTAIVDVDPDELRHGMALAVSFVRPEGSEAIPVFRP